MFKIGSRQHFSCNTVKDYISPAYRRLLKVLISFIIIFNSCVLVFTVMLYGNYKMTCLLPQGYGLHLYSLPEKILLTHSMPQPVNASFL